MLDLLHGAVRLAYVKLGFQVLMLPDAGDLLWGSCVT